MKIKWTLPFLSIENDMGENILVKSILNIGIYIIIDVLVLCWRIPDNSKRIVFITLLIIQSALIISLICDTMEKNKLKQKVKPMTERIYKFWEVLSDIKNIDSPNYTNIEPERGNEQTARHVKLFNGQLVKAVVTNSHDVFVRIVNHLQGDPILMKFMIEHCKSFGVDKIINDSRFIDYVDYWYNEPRPGVPLRYSMDKLDEMMAKYSAFNDDVYKAFKHLYHNDKIKEYLLVEAKKSNHN